MPDALSPPAPPTRAERLVPWAAALVVALPVVVSRMPPAADLAQYELVLAALRDLGDPPRFPSSLYQLDLGGSNQLFFVFAYPLSLLLPVDLVCRLLLGVFVGTLPLAVARAARHLGRSPLLGAVAAPLGLGFAFRWGLVSYLLGVVLFFLALPAFDRLARTPRAAEALRASGWALLLALAHGSASVFAGTALGVLALAHRHSLPRRALVLVPAAVSTLVFGLSFAVFQVRTTAYTTTVGQSVIAVGRRPPLFLWAAFGALPGARMHLVEAVTALALALLVARGRRASPPPSVDPRLAAIAALFVAQFFAWPSVGGGAGLIFHRFALVALVFGALALPTRGGAGAALGLTALAPGVAMLLAMLPLFRRVDASWRDLDPLIARVAQGSAVVELDLVEPPLVLSVYHHAHARVVALRGGRSYDDFLVLPHYSVRMRPALTWMRTRDRLAWPQDFIPSADLTRFRYVLVRLGRAHDPATLVRALAPEARPVARSGLWMLFESRLPRVPIDAPESWPARPAGATLEQRLRALPGPFRLPSVPDAAR